MADHFLRFTDAGQAALETVDAGFDRLNASTWALDHIGTVWTDPVYDGETLTAPATPLPGYHVNLRLLTGTLPDSLAAFVVDPADPYRRFAS